MAEAGDLLSASGPLPPFRCDCGFYDHQPKPPTEEPPPGAKRELWYECPTCGSGFELERTGLEPDGSGRSLRWRARIPFFNQIAVSIYLATGKRGVW